MTDNISKIFDFLKVINDLKKAYRFGNYDLDRDSSADHSWRLTLMIPLIAQELKIDIDILKAIKISLVHDLPEAITGDIAYMEIHYGRMTKEEKNKMEVEAINKIIKTLPSDIGKEIFSLWEEYEYSRSKEALFVKALDKIETIDHVLNKSRIFSDYDLIATYPDKHINNFPELLPVLKELKKRLKIEFLERNIPWKPEYDEIFNDKNEELIEEIDWNGNVIAVHPKKLLKEKMFPHKVCVVIPKGNNGKIVLCRRAKEQHPFPDTWCCAVGGKAIAGESPEECAKREMKEEIGKELEIVEVTKILYDKDDYKGLFHVFTTKVPVNHDDFHLDPKEIQFTKEFSIDEALEMIEKNPEEFAPTFREIIKEFAKHRLD